jgi:hypothetical protein
MKLIVAAMIAMVPIFSFAGVQPVDSPVKCALEVVASLGLSAEPIYITSEGRNEIDAKQKIKQACNTLQESAKNFSMNKLCVSRFNANKAICTNLSDRAMEFQFGLGIGSPPDGNNTIFCESHYGISAIPIESSDPDLAYPALSSLYESCASLSALSFISSCRASIALGHFSCFKR